MCFCLQSWLIHCFGQAVEKIQLPTDVCLAKGGLLKWTLQITVAALLCYYTKTQPVVASQRSGAVWNLETTALNFAHSPIKTHWSALRFE